MPLKNVHYQKLETEDSDEGGDDELPPTHVQLGPTSHTLKGTPLVDYLASSPLCMTTSIAILLCI